MSKGIVSPWRPNLGGDVLDRLLSALRSECRLHPEGATITEVNAAARCGYAAACYGLKELVRLRAAVMEKGVRPDLSPFNHLYRPTGKALPELPDPESAPTEKLMTKSGRAYLIKTELVDRVMRAVEAEYRVHPEGATLEKVTAEANCAAFFPLQKLVRDGRVVRLKWKRDEQTRRVLLYRPAGTPAPAPPPAPKKKPAPRSKPLIAPVRAKKKAGRTPPAWRGPRKTEGTSRVKLLEERHAVLRERKARMERRLHKEFGEDAG